LGKLSSDVDPMAFFHVFFYVIPMSVFHAPKDLEVKVPEAVEMEHEEVPCQHRGDVTYVVTWFFHSY